MTPNGSNDPAKTTPGTAVATKPPAPPKAPLVATGGQAMAIIPKSVEEMFRLADAIYGSGLAPNTLNTSQKVMVAIMAGAELGLPPWQATQSFAVIGNRPSIWGDAIPALLWSNGFKIREWFENEAAGYPDAMTAHCIVIRPDGTEIEGTFSVADAKEAQLWTKTGPWQTAKKRMLKMRARGFAARDGAADVLRGMKLAEEVGDYVTNGDDAVDLPPRQSVRERLRAAHHEGETSGFSQEHVAAELSDTPHNPETGEVIDAEFTDQVDDPSPEPQADPPAPTEIADVQEAVEEHHADPQSAPPAESGAETPASSQSRSPSAGSTSASTTASRDGGATTASPSDFPGDRKDPPAEQPRLTTAQRADEYEKRLKAATSTTKLTSIRNANRALLEDVDRVDPDRFIELEHLFNELYVRVEDRERAEAARK